MLRVDKNKKSSAQTKSVKKVDKPVQKLNEDMENEIKEAFNFYDTNNRGKIDRNQLRSILGNFAFTNLNVKEIEEQIKYEYMNQPSKDQFDCQEVIDLVTKKWFYGDGRQNEANEIFKLFDKKGKGQIGLTDIKQVFGQYLDIGISDADIQEFIEEADLDQDGYLNKEEFWQKLGYM